MEVREQRLVETLVYLAGTLVQDFDVVDLFVHLVEVIPELVDVEDAGLLLADGDGALQVVAVTEEHIRALELLQGQTTDGPCFDAYESGEMVMSSLDDPTASERWPDFVRLARAEGYMSVVSLPMRWRDSVLGALNMFRVDEEDLDHEGLVAARALADIASIAILQDRAAQDTDTLVDQLQTALNSRVAIEQAKGVIAQQLGVDMQVAFARLRKYARDRNLTLRQVSGDVVSGTLDPQVLPGE